MGFFETNEPYEIARNITGDSEYTTDLVSHVYLLMQNKDVKNEKRFFCRVAKQQYNWHNSEFNMLMQGREFNLNENSVITTDENETITDPRYRDCLNHYLKKEPSNMVEWFYKEITLMYLDGMSYREIEQKTGINLSYISKTINKVKNDIFNLYNSDSVKPSVYEYSLHKD